MALAAVARMGQMLQVLSGVGAGSWPLPAPKPWETTGFQQQGAGHSLFGRNCFAWRILLYLGLLPISRNWSFKLSGTSSVCQSWQTAEENVQVLCLCATGGSCLPPLHRRRVHPSPAHPARQRKGRRWLNGHGQSPAQTPGSCRTQP